MEVIGVALVVCALVGVVAYVQHRLKQKRIAALRAVATGIGLQFSLTDPGSVLALPFSLLRAGDGRGVENFMFGRYEGADVESFDYWYYDESRDSKGRRSRTYHRYTCLVQASGFFAPHLRLGRESFITRIGNAVGIDDLELEYEDFNKEFRVKCDDQRFAFSLLDGQMMEWLLQAPSFEAIEVAGSEVLLAFEKLDPESWASLPVLVRDLRARVPSVVFTTYPAR